MTRLLTRVATATLMVVALAAAPTTATPGYAAAPARTVTQPTDDPPHCGICPVPGDTICWETSPTKCPIPIVLAKPAAQDTPVHWHTAPGTAQPGVDYVPVRDAVAIIPAGQTTGYAEVEIIPDPALGGTRWFLVQFVPPPGGQLVRTQVTVTISPDQTTIQNGQSTSALPSR
jgi:hypothetical protein